MTTSNDKGREQGAGRAGSTTSGGGIGGPDRWSGFETDDWGMWGDEYRNHFENYYGQRGSKFEDYQHAYRYGHEMASHPEAQPQDWQTAEARIRERWEQLHPGSRWDDYAAAVRFGWENSNRR